MQYKSKEPNLGRSAHQPTEPRSPDNPPPRLTALPLPPYRFVPGLNPHPVRDPAGHSHGREMEQPPFMPPGRWRENEHYLFGVDLYNRAYWWEAHEAWETAWQTTDKDGAYGQFLQGLIQIAAAFLKWQMGEKAGLIKLYDIGIGRLETVVSYHPVFMGVDLGAFINAVNRRFATARSALVLPDAVEDFPYLELDPSP